MMRSASIRRLWSAARATFNRFPLVVSAALVAAVTAILSVDGPLEDTHGRLWLTASLGLPLFTALALLSEKIEAPRSKVLAWRILGVLMLVAFYFAWPGWTSTGTILRYCQYSAGLHFLVAVLPFVGSRETNGFWQYNRSLFLRFLLSSLFTGVLFVGLVIALVALDQLFGLDVGGDNYLRLWILLAIVFNTWFFLGGIPEDLGALERKSDYPTGLKIFSQFILTPLVAVYLVILTAYLVKVVATSIWPSGWIGYLVSSVAAVGILSLLLVHPIRSLPGNRWISTYARWFYIALLPSVVMLLLAIWQRIAQYGVTERRYVLMVLALWLAAIAGFYIITRSSNIKVIPASLCALAFLTSFGPWGAPAVSRRSQTTRLAEVLTQYDMLVDGRIRPTTTDLPFEDRKRISSGFEYLLSTHGRETVEEWFGGELARIDTLGTEGASARYMAQQRTTVIVSYLGLGYVGRWETAANRFFSLHVDYQQTVYEIEGFDIAYRFNRRPPLTFEARGEEYEVTYDTEAETMTLSRDGVTLIELALDTMFDRGLAFRRDNPNMEFAVPPEILRADAENDRMRARLYVSALSAREDDAGVEVTTIDGTLFIAFTP